LSEPPETIVGSVKVSVQLQSGAELLTLFFTPKRLILAHLGKRGVVELPGMVLLGRWGAGLERLFKSPSEARKKKRVRQGVEDMSPDEILKADKDNFDISYGDVVRAELSDSPHLVGILILTKDDKYEFYTSRDLASVSRLFRDTLGDKVGTR
jgi:hypothetical protein